MFSFFDLATQETEIIRKQYIKIHDAYGCLGVLRLNFAENNVLYLILVTGCFSVGKIGDIEIFRITQTQFISLQFQQSTNDEKINEVSKKFCMKVQTKNKLKINCNLF